EAELLVDPLPEGTSGWVKVGRDGEALLSWSENHTRVKVRARASGFHQAELFATLGPGSVHQVISLRPTAGYVGQVTTTLGDPVARAHVKVWRSWPARPTFVSPTGENDFGPQLAVMPARGELLMELYTDASGNYRINAFDERNVVDLVVAVVDDEDASVPLVVPMPHPGVELPVVVVRPTVPLQGQLLDDRGNPLLGIVVEYDGGPGAVRVVEQQTTTDSEGRFSFPRHLGWQHIRIQAPSFELAGAFDGDLELPVEPSKEPLLSAVATAGIPQVPLPSWIVVTPETQSVRVQLLAKGHVAGVVLDARSDLAIEGAVVKVQRALSSGEFELSALVRSQADGHFDAVIPAGELNHSFRLTLEHPHYLGVEWDVAPTVYRESYRRAPRHRLSPASVQASLMVGSWSHVVRRGPQAVLKLHAWSRASGDTRFFDEDGLFRVPQDTAPMWSSVVTGISWSSPKSLMPLPPRDGSQLVVLARRTDASGFDSVTAWEVDREGSGEETQLTFAPSLQLSVGVTDLGAGGSVRLRRTTWLPWFDVEQRSQEALWAGAGSGELLGNVQLSRPSWSRVELMERREPVDYVHDDSGEFEVTPENVEGTLRLFRRAAHLVSGSVTDHGGNDWPSLAVALCGPATESHRRDALGQTSWWSRPSQNFGEFRFEGVPAGDYTYLLYRSLGDNDVEVLAQRSVTVNHDLFQLNIWAEPQSSALRELVQVR
ncbi:MAG: hypothetical protein ACI9EF_003142, partial [Pseudohongiellaceae bacterium]